ASPTKRRRLVLMVHLVALAVLLGGLFIVSIMRLAPAQADSSTRDNLVESVGQIADFTRRQDRLPTKNELNLPSNVSYRQTSRSTYEVCAEFNLNTDEPNYTHRPEPSDDSYVDSYHFTEHKKGVQCFEFESSELQQQERLNPIRIT